MSHGPTRSSSRERRSTLGSAPVVGCTSIDDRAEVLHVDDRRGRQGRGSARRRKQVFEAGHSTGDGGTGVGLRILEEIAHDHGWTGEAGGVRFGVTGVDAR